MSLIEVITTICISLLFLLGLFLLLRDRNNHGSFRFIGMFFLLLALNFADGLLYLTGYYSEHPQLSGWEDALVLLYGPVLLIFSESTRADFRLRLNHLWHLLPFAILQSIIVLFYQTLPVNEKLAIINQAVNSKPPVFVILSQLILLGHFIGYVLFSQRRLKQQQEQLKKLYSSRAISWTLSIFNYLILLSALALMAMIIQSVGKTDHYIIAILMIVSTTTLFIFFLILQALDQPLLNTVGSVVTVTERLPDDERARITAKVEHFFTEERGFLNPELSIRQLAEQIAEPLRDVSQVVNSHMANNFYDLVNGYRIDAAQAMLSDQDCKLNITDVMYQVGYNSKSSFNTQFKQKTGLTPSAYRKKCI